MKVLSYNIHKGFAFANRRFVLAQIRSALASVDADVVFLQEVIGEHHRHARKVVDWPTAAQCEFLADSLWPHHAYGRNAVYDHGHHGNAILSKQPFSAWDNIDVTNHALERRGLLHGVIGDGAGTPRLHVICCHLDLLERGRLRQIQRLVKRIHAAVPAHEPVIVAGDFNDWTGQAGALLERELGLIEVHRAVNGVAAKSFPAWMPMLKLDRMYCRGLTPVRAQVLSGPPWRTLSDHAALFAELELLG